MKSFSKNLFSIVSIFFLVAACSHKKASSNNPEKYIGNWEVSDSQGQTFYMTLQPNGKGSTTRADGEFGRWQVNTDHIELEWVPKSFTLHFNPGQVTPIKFPPSTPAITGPTTAIKVEKIPKP